MSTTKNNKRNRHAVSAEDLPDGNCDSLSSPQQRIDSLLALLIEAAPVLRPTPDLQSLLRSRGSALSASPLQLYSDLFNESVTLIKQRWRDLAQRASNRVCSFCSEPLEDEDFDGGGYSCLVPEYNFDYKHQSIVVHQLKVRACH